VYTKHFGLRREPFSIAPDPRFLFMSERHREALAHLLYGLEGTGGVVLLTGEIGAGKTTVCRCFLEQIPPKCNFAYIFNPKLTVMELLQTVCEEFHIALPDVSVTTASETRTVKDYVDALNGFLLDGHAKGKNSVLIIDEAQNLSADVLEQLRLLTNLETAERKLLQIVLIGQPELRELLDKPEMEQLAQRITARYHLEALNESETAAYIRHRLVVSGRTGSNPFDSTARPRIHKVARGVPRRINLLCDRAMLGAYARGTQRINAAMIDEAGKEVFGAGSTRADLYRWVQRVLAGGPAVWAAGGAAGGALALALLLWAWPKRDAPSAAASAPVAGSSANASVAVAGQNSATTPMPTPTTTTPTMTPAPGAVPYVAGGGDPASGPPPVKLVRDQKQAWRLLALTSQLTLAEGDPCQAALKQKLVCELRSDSNVEQLRKTTSPMLLILREPQGQTSYIVHTGVADERTITVRGDGGERVKLDLSWLVPRWRGELGSFKPTSVAAGPTP
jgi:general secretion pathway protein A